MAGVNTNLCCLCVRVCSPVRGHTLPAPSSAGCCLGLGEGEGGKEGFRNASGMTPVSERGLANSQLKSKVLGAQDGRELMECMEALGAQVGGS